MCWLGWLTGSATGWQRAPKADSPEYAVFVHYRSRREGAEAAQQKGMLTEEPAAQLDHERKHAGCLKSSSHTPAT